MRSRSSKGILVLTTNEINDVSHAAEPSAASASLRGWLLVFLFHLLIWQPLNFAAAAADVMPSLAIRGTPAVLYLLLRLLAAALGVAAGVAIAGRRPAAPAIAKISVLVSAVVDLVIYLTPAFPSSRAPGDTVFYVAASLAYYSAWFAYLVRSRRVRALYSDDVIRHQAIRHQGLRGH